MALLTKIMLGLVILAGGGGIFLGLSIPDKVEEMKGRAEKSEKSSKAFQTELGTAKQQIATAEENLLNKDKEIEESNKAKTDAVSQLAAAAQAQKTAETLKTEAEENLGAANQAKTDAESKLAGAQQKASDWEKKYEQAIATANKAGGGGKELNEWKALKFNGNSISVDEVKKILAAKEKAEAIPVIEGKVTKILAQFGLIHTNLGPVAKVGQKYIVRRNKNLIARMSVTRIAGTEAICKLDKANSPSVPQVGDSVE